MTANPNSAKPKGAPTATPTVAAPRLEAEDSEAVVVPKVVLVIVVVEAPVVAASVTALAVTVARLLLGDVKPDQRFNITDSCSTEKGALLPRVLLKQVPLDELKKPQQNSPSST